MKSSVFLVAVMAMFVLLAGGTALAVDLDVTVAGDPVVVVNGTNDGDTNCSATVPPGSPAGEEVIHAIDDLTDLYLNFYDNGSGFIVTPTMGSTRLSGLRLYTAVDEDPRDPASYTLSGSNAGSGGPFTLISSGALSLPAGRNALGQVAIANLTLNHQEVSFAPALPYTTYRLIFPTLKNAGAACAMHIAEVELLSRPELIATKTNDVGGNANLGNSWTWAIKVDNIHAGSAVFTNGNTILTDQLPTTNITYAGLAVGSFTNITNQGNIACSISGGGLLTCTASGADVTIGALTGTFSVSFDATPTAVGLYINPTGGVGCSVDPDDDVTETDDNNNTCSSTVGVSAPDITATKTNNVGGATTLGGSWTWAIKIDNIGDISADFASGEWILADQLPTTNITYSAPIVGSSVDIYGSGSVDCQISGAGLLTCVAAAGNVELGVPTGSFTVSFTATPSATGVFVNPTGGQCLADPNDEFVEPDENNNGCVDTVTVTVSPVQMSYAAPTLNTWGILIFIVLAGVGAIYFIRRKRAVS